MYGPPPDCKRVETGGRDSLRKCIRPLVETRSPGHDDDPRVSVLINHSVTKDLLAQPGFPTRRLTVLSSCSLLSRPWWDLPKLHSSSWRWKSGKRSVLSKRQRLFHGQL